LIAQILVNLAIALGIGLLIGAERERRKGSGPARGSAGIRTFALASLAGGMSIVIGGELLLAVTVLGIAGLAMLSYARSKESDPGLTSELALMTTTLLGALSVREPALAAGIAVVVAVLLASRNRIHRFVKEILTEQELHDALMFAAASLVILPLTPDRPVGPFQVLNLRVLWTLAVMVMLISSVGYVALRALGPRLGLPLTGLASGFVSSVATIGSMGARAAQDPTLVKSAVAGAILSTVSTIVQLGIVIGITHGPTLAAFATPLIFSGVMAVAYAALFISRGLTEDGAPTASAGRAFNWRASVVFAATVSMILFASVLLRRWLGSTGLLVGAGVAGFADTHAVAISAASMASASQLTPAEAISVVLTGFTTNTIAKIIVAATAGGRRFALRIIPGLILVLLAAWAGCIVNQ
jgi:uncharacterized membrane protein (DUF4010 family)